MEHTGAIIGVDQPDNVGRTALRYAAAAGHVEAARALVELKASIDLPDKPTLTTPLMSAVQKGHVEMVKFLLRAQADVSISDRHGETAVVKARIFEAGPHAKRMITLLLEAEAVWPKPWNGQDELETGRLVSSSSGEGEGAIISDDSAKAHDDDGAAAMEVAKVKVSQ